METLPEMLKSWGWHPRVYPDAKCVWVWTHSVALMPLPDRCAVKMSVGGTAVSIRVFSRTMPGDIDSRTFYMEGYGGRMSRGCSPSAFSSEEIDLSKFRLDEFCGDIEKYIQFYMPTENEYAKQ